MLKTIKLCADKTKSDYWMINQTKKIQIVLWLGFLGVLVGVMGGWLARSDEWLRFFENLHWSFASVVAAILCWLGMQVRSATQDLGHWWFAVGMSVYALGQIVWDLQQWLLDYQRFPSSSDLFYLWLGPCLGIGLFQLVSQRVSPNQLSFFSLDCVVSVVAAVALVMVFYLPKQGRMDVVPIMFLVALPSSLFAAMGMGIVTILTLHLRLTLAWAAFLLAMLSIAWSWMQWNSLVLDGVTVYGEWFNSFSSLGILLLGISIVYLDIQPQKDPRWIRYYEAMLRLLPLAAIVLVSVAVIATLIIPSLPDSVIKAIWMSAVVVIVLAAVRQYALLREYDQLITTEIALARERQLLNTIVESLPGAFVLLNEQGRILKHNSYIADFTGANGKLSKPLHIHSVIPPQNQANFDDQLNRVLLAGAASFEQPLCSSNQQVIIHSFSFKRIIFKDTTYLMGIGLDISTLKEAITAVEESRNLLQQVIDTLPLRVFWKDKEFHYLGCNAAFATDTGLSDTKQIEGLMDHDLTWSREESECFIKDDKEVMSTLVPKMAFDEIATCADGKRIWIRTSKVPLFDTHGELVGILGIYGDVTERKHLEEMQHLAGLVFEHSRESIMVSDANNRVVAVNPAFTHLTGYQSEEIIGKDPSILRAEGKPLEKMVFGMEKLGRGAKMVKFTRNGLASASFGIQMARFFGMWR